MRWLLVLLLLCNGIYFFWEVVVNRPDAAVPAASPSPLQYPAEKRLLLVQERQQLRPAEDEVVAQHSEPASAASDVVPQVVDAAPALCWQIGPFPEAVSAKQVSQRLLAVDIAMRTGTFSVQAEPDYWVHVPPLPSYREALQRLRELQAEKVDSFLIADGELKNGISLGFFTSRERAEKILSQRREQGIAAEIQLVPRVTEQLWGVIAADDYDKLSDPLWQKVAEGIKGLQRQKNYCDKIASLVKFE